jgi:lipopolysaccharide transport system permease protein
VLFPAEVLPAIGVVTATLGEVIGLVLLVGLAALAGTMPTPAILLLPVVITARMALTLGLSWIASVLNVFFGDIGESLGLVMTALMFVTPIFYPADLIPDGFRWLLSVNPLYFLVSIYRWAVLGLAPPPGAGLLLGVSASLSLAVGLWVFRQTIDRAKDVL